MAEFTVYVLHRAITVRAAPPVSSRVRTRPRFNPYRDYDEIDSTSEFAVRDADEADAVARVEQLRQQRDQGDD